MVLFFAWVMLFQPGVPGSLLCPEGEGVGRGQRLQSMSGVQCGGFFLGAFGHYFSVLNRGRISFKRSVFLFCHRKWREHWESPERLTLKYIYIYSYIFWPKK